MAANLPAPINFGEFICEQRVRRIDWGSENELQRDADERRLRPRKNSPERRHLDGGVAGFLNYPPTGSQRSSFAELFCKVSPARLAERLFFRYFHRMNWLTKQERLV